MKSLRRAASSASVAARGKIVRPPGNHFVTSGPIKIPPVSARSTSAAGRIFSGVISRQPSGAISYVGQIKFVSLRVNHHVHAPENLFRLRLRREAFHAADAEQFYAARQLPALRDGNAPRGCRCRSPAPVRPPTTSICSRPIFASRQDSFNHAERVASRARRFRCPRPARSPSRATATLRCGEENSSAKIVINNPPFRFTHNFNFHHSSNRQSANRQSPKFSPPIR